MSHAPWEQFKTWYAEGVDTEPRVPDAMQIATVDADGHRNVRTVLLKDFGPDGLVFYTNLRSAKAVELVAHPHAAFLLHFKGLERQIRGRGPVEQVADEVADAYFASRARGSQLGAWASPQSQVIPDRETLEDAVERVTAEYDGTEVPRPPFWSGFRIRPDQVEFWQGRPDRLHDRWNHRLHADGSWSRERLAP